MLHRGNAIGSVRVYIFLTEGVERKVAYRRIWVEHTHKFCRLLQGLGCSPMPGLPSIRYASNRQDMGQLRLNPANLLPEMPPQPKLWVDH